MVRRSFFLSLILALLLLAACEKQPAHTHSWDAANCLRGELCWSCKETRGEALGHDWVDATCEKAKHCSRCGKSEGKALPHTSDGNATCSRCKQALNTTVMLNGEPDQVASPVYDGAVFSMRMFTSSSAGSNFSKDMVGVGLPERYVLYDSSNKLLYQGEWGKIKAFSNETEFIARLPFQKLAKGSYRIEYIYYKDPYLPDLEPGEYRTEENRYYISKSEPFSGVCFFEVW